MQDMSQEKELLAKLLTFYKRKYTGTEIMSKFFTSVEDLIVTGDIKRVTFLDFCLDNDIEPVTKRRRIETKQKDFKAPTEDPCSRGYNRSHC